MLEHDAAPLDDPIDPGPHSPLTDRERTILAFVAHGYSAKQAAQLLGLAPRTVERYIELIRLKLQARNTPHMVSRAFHSGTLQVVPRPFPDGLAEKAGPGGEKGHRSRKRHDMLVVSQPMVPLAAGSACHDHHRRAESRASAALDFNRTGDE